MKMCRAEARRYSRRARAVSSTGTLACAVFSELGITKNQSNSAQTQEHPDAFTVETNTSLSWRIAG